MGKAFTGALSRVPLHLLVILVAIAWSLPTIALLTSSFRDPSAIAASGWWTAFAHPEHFTLENYSAVMNQRGMAEALRNSLIITIPSTLLVILVAASAAYAFARMEFPGRTLLFLAIVGMLVVPLQMTLIPVLRLFTQLTVDVPMPLLGGTAVRDEQLSGGMAGAHGLRPALCGLPAAQLLWRAAQGALRVGVP